ncbi:MAG: trypsin-like peptidase domain-containing protein [Clostridia bacterium]
MIYLKKICFLSLLIPLFVFSGCLQQSKNSEIDLTVDMTPRLLSAQNAVNFADVVENVRGAVVGISSQSASGYSVGSGVAIADGGYILTNHHVVAKATQVKVFLANKTEVNATVVWLDSALDLAVIKAENNLPYLAFGSNKNVRVGDDVLAIGTPLTLQFQHTVTKGIVSAKSRTIQVDGKDGPTYLQNLIQHDASINPGNSGGPLISGDGKVIGINTLKASEAEGIGFAIPIEVGKAIVNRVATKKAVKTPYIGIFGFDADVAGYYGQTAQETGVYVVQIDSAGPASKAGLKNGDVIQSVNNTPILTMLDLRVALYSIDLGSNIEIMYKRNGKTVKVGFKAVEK